MGEHKYTSVSKMWLHLWTCYWTIKLYISLASFNRNWKKSKWLQQVL